MRSLRPFKAAGHAWAVLEPSNEPGVERAVATGLTNADAILFAASEQMREALQSALISLRFIRDESPGLITPDIATSWDKIRAALAAAGGTK